MGTMKRDCLLVLAHPVQESLCGHVARFAQARPEAAGHRVTLLDLYAEGFDPCLTAAERLSYHAGAYRSEVSEGMANDLQAAEVLLLVFPTWWFGLPAMLKGYVDRVFAPGVAFDHTSNFGPIKPRLHSLRHVAAITTLGSPWWVDRFVMRSPVRRILRSAVIAACAPKARFGYLPLHGAETATGAHIAGFERRIDRYLACIHS